DGSVRQITTPADGTSNTIQLGESTPAGLSADALTALTHQLGDKFISLGSSSGNSDNNAFLSGTDDMELCAFGRFARRERTFFSSDVGDLDTTTDSNGTWSVIDVNGAATLELRVENSSERNPARVVRFSMTT